MVNSFRVLPKTIIDFVENWFSVKIPVFSLVFHLFFTALLKTTGKFELLTLKVPTRFTFLQKKDAQLENRTFKAFSLSQKAMIDTNKNKNKNTYILS